MCFCYFSSMYFFFNNFIFIWPSTFTFVYCVFVHLLNHSLPPSQDIGRLTVCFTCSNSPKSFNVLQMLRTSATKQPTYSPLFPTTPTRFLSASQPSLFHHISSTFPKHSSSYPFHVTPKASRSIISIADHSACVCEFETKRTFAHT